MPTGKPYGEVLDEMDHEAKYQSAVMRQQLVARIKRSSKYAYQAPKYDWFNVRVVPDAGGYGLRGNGNNYRFSDVALGVRLDDGTVVKLK